MNVDRNRQEQCPSVEMPVAGDVIDGKYRIVEVAGRGGMSVVYRAVHRELDHEVAIKVLSTDAASRSEYVLRLKREARVASLLRGEHVVRVHDIGELPSLRVEQRIPYIVMEYLHGSDLAAVLARRGPFAVHLAVECMLQLSEALAEAHAHGILHRDLKPANVFLVDNVVGRPRIKVLDFGISCGATRTCRKDWLKDAPALTDPGVALGTPSYMAPEQMEAARRVDERADIWALGAIFYELLVGKPPYAGKTLPQIFVNVMRSKAPRPSAARSDVPRAVDAIVKRCLSVDPARRFRSMSELARALSSLDRTYPRPVCVSMPSVESIDGGAEHGDVTLPSAFVVKRESVPAAPSRTSTRSSIGATRTTLAATFGFALLLGGALSALGIAALHEARGASSAHGASSSTSVVRARFTSSPGDEPEAAISIAPRKREARGAGEVEHAHASSITDASVSVPFPFARDIASAEASRSP